MKRARGTGIIIIALGILFCAGRGYGQIGVFDRTGIIPGHGSYSSLPEESVDLFTGNVTLRYLDYRLPGPNGLDVEIWRVYNSKILKDQSGSVMADHKSWVGIGWTLHMGRVHNYDTTTPIIEFPDGRWETTYPDRYYPLNQKKNITRDYLRYDRANYKLYFKNGVIWSFGVTRTITRADGSSESVRLVSLIQNSYGHSIIIQYDTGKPSIDKITDSMGRVIDFTSTGTTYKKLASMKVKNATGSDVYYYYSVNEFPNGYHRLVSFTPPLIPATTYEYLDGTNNQYELTKVTTSYGGLLEFSYVNHTFYFNFTSLDSRVASQKKITFNPGEQAKVWNFTYPSYYGSTTGTATVEGPEFSTSVTSHAYDASCPWKIGLISSHTVGDGSASVAYDWTFQQISNVTWMVLGVDMGTAKGPLPFSIIGNKVGDSILKTECLYEREATKKYGFPTRINVYSNGAINPKTYTELSYYYETSTDYLDKYMLAYVSDKRDYAGDGAILKRTTTSYFQETGKWGAVDWIRRYSAEATYHTWDYDYICSNPNLVKITVDPPGDIGVQEVSFSFGIENEFIYSDGVPRYSRVISQYDSSVSSEENKHGGTLAYSYDSLGRITYINRPTPFNDTSLTWRPGGENKVVITQGGHAVTKYWDAMGRETGHTETGGGIILHYLKVLDAEGRLKEESVGSTDPAHRYAYLFNNAGQVTRITDPQQKVTNLSYSGTRTTVVDPELRTTLSDYEDMPGMPTKVTDALGRESVHTYDAIGRLIEVIFNGARTHSYQYDWLDNVLSENHPETGVVRYFYDSQELRLDRKTWGTTEQKFNYTEAGQLSKLETYKNSVLEESISYGYDLKGRIGQVSGSSGWYRTNITYNIWGSVMGETISIAGLSSKSLSYTYDNDNNRSGITYPDGKSVTTSYNTLNMPQAISFNGKTIVDNASYGAYKNPVSISIAGNGTSYSATYSSSGLLGTASLSKGASILFDASYSYDYAGNITGISSTSPAPALNATFGYDALNRLTSATYSTGRVSNYVYEYDAYGNMKTARENGVAVFDKQYDGQNRIAGLAYDERGNLLSWGDKNYYWDSLNRLRYISNLSGEVLGQYLYDDRGLRLRALPPLPEINIKQDDTNIPDEGSYYFKVVTQQDKTFTVENLGNKNLELGEVIISGQDADCFDVIQQPSSPVVPLSSTSFIIRFNPLSGGLKIATLTLQNDDPDENPYNILLFGNYVPEINIYDFANGSSYDFGTFTIGYHGYETFTIQNLGTAPLTLTSSHIDGPDFQYFGIELQPTSPVPAGGTTNITIRFSPTAERLLTAYLSIESDDSDENPYIITLYGTGKIGPLKIIESKSQIDITFPDGDERLLAGTEQTIAWSGNEGTEYVRIEYSVDNGSTYRVITDRTPNNGTYNWIVPKDVSSSCLIRITESEGHPFLAPKIISFEFSFKISCPHELYVPVPGFSVDLGVPDFGMKTYNSLALEFAPYEASRNLCIAANNFWAAPKSFDVFLDRWHRVKAQFDLDNRIATIWMDNEILYNNVSLNVEPIHASYGAVSFSSDATARSRIRIDDVEVNISDPELRLQAEDATNVVQWKPIFVDEFEAYRNNLVPLRRGGWVKVSTASASENELDSKNEVSPLGQLLEAYWIPVDDRAEELGIVVDSDDSISGLGSLRFEDVEEMNTKIIKIFSLPTKTPFDNSKRSFMVVNRIADTIDDHYRRLTRRSDSGKSATVSIGHSRYLRGKAAAGKPRTKLPTRSKQMGGTDVRMASALPVGTYYIYAFDGRLLAEYNALGFCTRDYIYMANRLIAEYHPLENKYYYYTSDQINSTRIVTDDLGTVVYAAAHDPYGGEQLTWTNTYNPSLKFSGKERDEESGLDYFGARYYDRSLYRFLSVDPVIRAPAALLEPQRWNLYAYCGNNPVNYIDPTGRELIYVGITKTSNAKNFRPYLDSEFYEKLFEFILWAQRNNLQIRFTDAYRTPGDHRAAQANYQNAAQDISLHQCGFAVDLSVRYFDEETINRIKDALDDIGLSYYGPYNNILHIYLDVAMEDRESYMTQALVEFLKLTGREDYVYNIEDYYLLIRYYDFINDPWFGNLGIPPQDI